MRVPVRTIRRDVSVPSRTAYIVDDVVYAPIRLVSPDDYARLVAFTLPTYAEQCAALEMIRYRKRQAAHRAPKFSEKDWETAFR